MGSREGRGWEKMMQTVTCNFAQPKRKHKSTPQTQPVQLTTSLAIRNSYLYITTLVLWAILLYNFFCFIFFLLLLPLLIFKKWSHYRKRKLWCQSIIDGQDGTLHMLCPHAQVSHVRNSYTKRNETKQITNHYSKTWLWCANLNIFFYIHVWAIKPPPWMWTISARDSGRLCFLPVDIRKKTKKSGLVWSDDKWKIHRNFWWTTNTKRTTNLLSSILLKMRVMRMRRVVRKVCSRGERRLQRLHQWSPLG